MPTCTPATIGLVLLASVAKGGERVGVLSVSGTDSRQQLGQVAPLPPPPNLQISMDPQKPVLFPKKRSFSRCLCSFFRGYVPPSPRPHVPRLALQPSARALGPRLEAAEALPGPEPALAPLQDTAAPTTEAASESAGGEGPPSPVWGGAGVGWREFWAEFGLVGRGACWPLVLGGVRVRDGGVLVFLMLIYGG